MADLRQLMELCKLGDTKAQHTLFTLTGPKMLGLCRRYCKNIDDARDAMQDGFVKVFKNIDKYRGDSAPETWMSRIFINTAIDQFKKGLTYNQLFDSFEHNENYEELEAIESDFPCTPEEIIAVLDTLPEGYRIVFNLYCIENNTHKQIAETLGISEGTSKSQYARAKKAILDALIKTKKISGQF